MYYYKWYWIQNPSVHVNHVSQANTSKAPTSWFVSGTEFEHMKSFPALSRHFTKNISICAPSGNRFSYVISSANWKWFLSNFVSLVSVKHFFDCTHYTADTFKLTLSYHVVLYSIQDVYGDRMNKHLRRMDILASYWTRAGSIFEHGSRHITTMV